MDGPAVFLASKFVWKFWPFSLSVRGKNMHL